MDGKTIARKLAILDNRMNKNHTDMILKSLKYISNSLEFYLKNQLQLNESVVLLNNIINQNGSIPIENQNKVIISLVEIEKETQRFNSGYAKNTDRLSSTIKEYNLDVLITSNFEDYQESLKFLERSLYFFEENVVFDTKDRADLPLEIERLTLEKRNLNSAERQSLYISLGAKYKPSMVYKIRIISVNENAIVSTTSATEIKKVK